MQGERTSSIFRINLRDEGSAPVFRRTEEEDIWQISMSEDEQRVVLLHDAGVRVLNYRNWRTESEFQHPVPLYALWLSNSRIIISGAYKTEIIDLGNLSARLVCLSQPGEYGFARDTAETTVTLAVAGEYFRYQDSQKTWEQVFSFSIDEPNISTSDYRVYLDTSGSSGGYDNMVMIRDIAGYRTRTLFPPPDRQFEPFPSRDEPVNFENFSHGSRIRRREVALVFNAIDTVEGLTEVLYTLEEYGLRVTFFLNGEFIRRHPGAVKEIADSNHEVGSLFYTYFDMTDTQFRLDTDFIKRGLARNEDDYFALTGEELALLWHAPYYFVNNAIIQASKEMNYTYVSRDIDPLDWVEKNSPLYQSSAVLLENVMERKAPGSIIPIRLGVTEEGREDYLFEKVDILINALISEGYKIVPVTTLLEHAK